MSISTPNSNTTLTIVKYPNANAVEATWKDTDGKNVRCRAYADVQIASLRDDAAVYGGDLTPYDNMLDEVESNIQPPPPPVISRYATITADGITVDGNFTWKDITGVLYPRTAATGGAIATSLFNSKVAAWPLPSAAVIDCIYHVPHDYLPGSDVFLHLHWGHQGTAISGTFRVRADISIASRTDLNASVMSDAVTQDITISPLTLANAPRWGVRIDEIQASTPGGSSTMIDTNSITVDSLIVVRYTVVTIPSISGSASSNRPFILAADLHMQSNIIGTKNKDPDFYA